MPISPPQRPALTSPGPPRCSCSWRGSCLLALFLYLQTPVLLQVQANTCLVRLEAVVGTHAHVLCLCPADAGAAANSRTSVISVLPFGTTDPLFRIISDCTCSCLYGMVQQTTWSSRHEHVQHTYPPAVLASRPGSSGPAAAEGDRQLMMLHNDSVASSKPPLAGTASSV